MAGLKFVDGSDTEVVGPLLPFGGPTYLGGKDLSREYFSTKTDFCLDWYAGGIRPLLYHHGLDQAVKTAPVGKITSIEMKADGGWMRGQLDKHNAYFAEVSQLIKQQKVGLSSGAMAHLVETDAATGEIRRWPVVEGSITPTPCNPLAVVDFAALTKHYKSADLAIPDALKAVWSTAEQNNLPDSSFAYIEPGGTKDDEGKTVPRSKRHYVYRDGAGKIDAPHLRNALARSAAQINAGGADGAIAEKARPALIRAAKEAGIGDYKARLTAEERAALSDSDYAYIDSDGGKHLPLHDAAHVRDAIGRFQEQSFEDDGAKKQAARKILAAAKRLGIDVSPDSAVTEAAGQKAAKALMESDDAAGGFMADGDDGGPDDDGDAADRSAYAGVAHTEMRNHTHRHADGSAHRHGHRHDAGDPSHDTSTHPHAVGMPMPAGKAAPPTTAMATERSFEDIRGDISDLLNPVGPVPDGCYTSVVATYPEFVIVCRHEEGEDDTYWRVAYTLDDDMEPVLGDSERVDNVWVPRAGKAAPPTPLTLNAIAASRQAAALAHEAKALGERRAAAQRPLSAPNYRAIASAKAALSDAAERCAAVLADSDALEGAQAKAAALASPESLEIQLAILNLAAGLLPDGPQAA